MINFLNILASGNNLPDSKIIIDVVKPWVDWGVSVLFGLLGLFCIVKCAIIAFKISKAADDPEERSQHVRALVWPLIGIFAAILVPTIIVVIMNHFSPIQIK